MRKSTLFLSFFLCLQFAISQDKLASIDSATVKKHLYILASDEMEGRKSGTPGIEKAAQYIEKELQRIGLSTYNMLPTYRQNFVANDMNLFNIIGVLEGKSKKNEYVLITSHYDHIGMKNGG